MTGCSQDCRLLSHRLRGFDDRESTVAGMVRALTAGVCHVEFDLRQTKDGELVAFHDPFIEVGPADWPFVDQLTLGELQACPSGRVIPTLADMARAFAQNASKDALMHVDVKVGGQEEKIRDILRTAGVLRQTVLVSWLPSVLKAFHASAPEVTLCFSHLTLARAPWMFPVALRMSNSGLIDWLRRIGAGTTSSSAHTLEATRLYVHEDGDPAGFPSGDELLRSNPGHLVRDAVRGDLRRILARTKGYVCIPTAMATRALVRDYERDEIGVAVFSAKSKEAAHRILDNLSPRLVYVDDANAFKS
jgi:hypothetical protein